MKVEIVDYTENPIDVISKCAGISYGKTDSSNKRVFNCMKAGHGSVFEHAKFTVRVEDISRACSHQLVRHRMASYTQESQRYVKVDISKDDWYVTPPSMEGSESYKRAMANAAEAYTDALAEGIKPEDARYMLPNACKTTITVTMNYREFFWSFLVERNTKQAQWEIRNLAGFIKELLRRQGGQTLELMNMYEGVVQNG